MIELTLDWPDPVLSPNRRLHWRAKSRFQQAAHLEGWTVTRKWLETNRPAFAETFPVTMIFCPPDNRARDLDNLSASMKWTLDGIADALDVNDKRFRPVTADLGDVCKPGKVIVRIGTPPALSYAEQHQREQEQRYELPANRLKG